MWVNVAKWMWRLKKKNKPMPSFDSTSVESFRRSLKSADTDGNPANIHTLYNNVLEKLGRSGYDGVKDEEFIFALEEVLQTKRNIKAADTEFIIAKLHSLSKTEISLDSPSINTSETQVLVNTDSAQLLTQAEGSDDSPQRSLKQVLASNKSLSLYCKLLGGAVVILTMALAILASLLWEKRRTSGTSPESNKAIASENRSSSNSSWADSQEIGRLKQELLAEKMKYAEQSKEINELKARDNQHSKVNSTSPDRTTPSSNTVSPQIISTPQAIPSAITVQFADKPENRYLTRLYPDSEAYRPLLIRFSADPSVSEARFEFNPAADQFFFTHNGVDQLTGTFAYSPPDWLKNPQTIRTLVPGRLRRDGTGWFVDAPAQIEIC